MSKPTIRILISVMIVLAVLAGIYASVRAAASNAGVQGNRAFLTAGLLADTKHVRSASSSALDAYQVQSDSYYESGHGGCEHENHSSPDD